MRGLSRRHSSPPVRRRLPGLSHRPRMDGFRGCREESPEPISAVWRARSRALRFLPSQRRGWSIYRVEHAMRKLPSERLPKVAITKPRGGETLHQCEDCHGMDRWQGANFDHAALTNFALVGAHASLACVACHMAGRFAGTPTDCFGCHVDRFQCHAESEPRGRRISAQLRHVPYLRELAGRDVQPQHHEVRADRCACERTMLSRATSMAGSRARPMDCQGCHLPDFQKTTNPNHAQGNIPTTCDNCHSTTNWQNAKFDHNLSTFKLTGAHTRRWPARPATWAANYSGIPADCAGCHIKDYNKTTQPNHCGDRKTDYVRTVPYHGAVAADHLLARQNTVSAHRGARQPGMHAMPHREAISRRRPSNARDAT